MKKSIKSIIAFSLILSIIIALSPYYVSNTNSKAIISKECIQKDEVFEYISDIDNVRDISPCINDEDELDWYYVSKGKNQIPEGPKESIDFLKRKLCLLLR